MLMGSTEILPASLRKKNQVEIVKINRIEIKELLFIVKS